MGEPNAAHVDTAALLSIASRYDAAGDLLGTAVRMHLAQLAFDGATAGRAHIAAGDAVCRVVEDMMVRLQQWSRAATEIASMLRLCADRYVDADARASGRLG